MSVFYPVKHPAVAALRDQDIGHFWHCILSHTILQTIASGYVLSTWTDIVMSPQRTRCIFLWSRYIIAAENTTMEHNIVVASHAAGKSRIFMSPPYIFSIMPTIKYATKNNATIAGLLILVYLFFTGFMVASHWYSLLNPNPQPFKQELPPADFVFRGAVLGSIDSGSVPEVGWDVPQSVVLFHVFLLLFAFVIGCPAAAVIADQGRNIIPATLAMSSTLVCIL